MGGNIFALFCERHFRFLLQENKIIVISQIFILIQSLLIPITLTRSFNFSLIRQLTLVNQKLQSLWENSSHGGKTDISELIDSSGENTGSGLNSKSIDIQTEREETHSLLLVEHSLDIERSVDEREHFLLGGFEHIVQVHESFVEGHLVFVEIVVDVGYSDELGDCQVGLLSVVITVR